MNGEYPQLEMQARVAKPVQHLAQGSSLQNPYFYEYLRAPECATVDCFHMTTRSSLSDAAYPRGGYSPLWSRPSPPARRISNRSYRRLEINISPTKQRTGVLSTRSKSGVFWRQMAPPCRGYSDAQEGSFPLNSPGRRERVGCGSRPSKCNGKGSERPLFSRATNLYSRITTHGLSNRQLETIRNGRNPFRNRHMTFSNRLKISESAFPATPHRNSSQLGNLWNLKSSGSRRQRAWLLGAAFRHGCHLFMAPGKTNSGVPTSKKAVRVVIVLEVYTPGRFLRRYL
jgi:hypothetical protein